MFTSSGEQSFFPLGLNGFYVAKFDGDHRPNGPVLSWFLGFTFTDGVDSSALRAEEGGGGHFVLDTWKTRLNESFYALEAKLTYIK